MSRQPPAATSDVATVSNGRAVVLLVHTTFGDGNTYADQTLIESASNHAVATKVDDGVGGVASSLTHDATAALADDSSFHLSDTTSTLLFVRHAGFNSTETDSSYQPAHGNPTYQLSLERYAFSSSAFSGAIGNDAFASGGSDSSIRGSQPQVCEILR